MTVTWQSVLLNVASWLLGIWSCRKMFHHSRGSNMAERPPLKFWQGRGFPWFIAAVVLVLFGVQTLQYQRAGNERARDSAAQARCLSHWGADVVSALSARVDANDSLKAAQTRRDEALDAIIGVVIASRAQKAPTVQTRKDFDAALSEFAAAKAELTRTQRSVSKTLDANPYPPPPTLTCH